MDLYEELMGAAPSDPQKTAQIAAALRRRSNFGELGMLTGDKVLGQYGQNQVKRADEYAGRFQDTRQRDIDNAQTAKYQDYQMDYMGKNLAQQDALARLHDATTRRGQDMSLLAAQIRAENAREPKIGKLTFADRQKLEGIANTRNGAQSLLESFDPSYTQKLGPGPQSRLVNTLASYGVGTEGGKQAADWWAQWNLIYTLPQRNATFGATLTPGERQSWFESDINPSMGPEQIKKRIQNVVNILNNKGALADKTYRAQGFDPEAIDAYGLQGVGAEPPGESPPVASGVLSPEEQAELDSLRKKYGRSPGTP